MNPSEERQSGIRDDESGMALVMVLGVLAVTMVLLAHMSLIVSIISRESYQISEKYGLRYAAESAADMAYWFHLTDRRLFSDRNIGGSSNEMFREDHEGFEEPWMLDGSAHEMDEGDTVVYMTSGENGTRVDNLATLKNGLDASDDADLIEEIDDFIDKYDDYTDSDDLLKLNGYENDDYSADGIVLLPRNGKMQFKAELYWIPGWRNVLTREIATVPPSGIEFSYDLDKPSLFSATQGDIAFYLDLAEDSSDVKAIVEAVEAWQQQHVALEDSLDIDLLTQVKSKFSLTEAAVALIHANAYNANHEILSSYRVVREAKMGSRSIFADKHKNCLSIWERRWE